MFRFSASNITPSLAMLLSPRSKVGQQSRGIPSMSFHNPTIACAPVCSLPGAVSIANLGNRHDPEVFGDALSRQPYGGQAGPRRALGLRWDGHFSLELVDCT